MTATQLTMPLARLISDRGYRLATSLRPGAWIKPLECDIPVVVLQNSNKTQQVELRMADGHSLVLRHERIDLATYLGQGKRRLWREFLPRWLREYFCPYSGPAKKRR